MMLHEAVMLEIYRQALNASELASPRCQSRESNASLSGNNEARCPSNESHYSVNETHTSGQTPTPTTPPVGLPLPATLPPAAAAALLPPQSAAMAAYFNAAAAAAAQQNHLLLTNPLAAAASLVQQATQHQQHQQQQQQQHSSHSPSTTHQAATPTPADATAAAGVAGGATTPPTGDVLDTSALDFSTKRGRRNTHDYGNASEDDEDAAVCDVDADDDRAAAGGGGGARNDNDADINNDNETDDVNSPLDLSLNNGRKRQVGDENEQEEEEEEEEPVRRPNRKLARSNDYKSLPASSTWVPPINPYLAAVAAASMSPKTPLSLDWNAKTKISPNEATKALEKMTEMTRLGAAAAALPAADAETPTRHSANSVSSSHGSNSSGTPSNGRHSAWQSHWLNKGADAVKDVFKCVWCKQSFATLASLTTHMKETQHCGVNVPPTVAAANASASVYASHQAGNQAASSHSHHARHTGSNTQPITAAHSPASASNVGKSDLNMLIKETMPLPRKLVRGQDVWLGKGAEQTRQILKCMWCGQSFRSLAEMTSHMQETQHYTNIISQEQIISWKSTDDKGSSSSSRDNSSSCGSNSNRGCPSTNSINTNAAPSPQPPLTPNANATVSAVLTCKVCEQAFPTLKELSAHMLKNNHYTEHMMRTAGGGGAASASPVESAPTMIRSRSRQGGKGEKRKKSLPVRKLLELERAQQDFKASNMDQALTPLREFKATTKLQCETCGEKFGLDIFVEHIRQCIARSMQMEMSAPNASHEEQMKSPYLQPPGVPEFAHSPKTPQSRSESRRTMEDNASPLSASGRADIICPLPSDSDKSSSGTSVLNALEQLIEKSFDARPRHAAAFGAEGSSNTPLGSSILKRLGIDDNVDYTKPLMDPQTMQFLRSYSGYAASSSRDRSASESSSISERCSSRLESFTPERNYEQTRQPTPRLTPDKFNHNTKESSYPIRIKSEPVDCSESRAVVGGAEQEPLQEMPKKISVKKEFSMTEELEPEDYAKAKDGANSTEMPRSHSPSEISERSITPKSVGERKPLVGLPESSSLSALSSMFNNLGNMQHTNVATNLEMNNNSSANSTPTTTTAASATPNKKSNANPLAALQKLCDTNEKSSNPRSSSGNMLLHSQSPNSQSPANGTNAAPVTSGNGSSGMLAFSWACNDAMMTATDAVIKCSFCDTPFSSKGAYRHHLSKVHFIKDEPDVISLKSPGAASSNSPKSQTTSPRSITSAKSPAAQRSAAITPPSTSMSSAAAAATVNPYDESPQSKFLKYTELAKQLSSKNA
uniref:C2H2-type domain-containing protein n=1 Tax=Stomoxys calcitrans TaxID=35570 RepID=A0A1I8PTG1_STOCA